jgi:hypothetical protein
LYEAKFGGMTNIGVELKKQNYELANDLTTRESEIHNGFTNLEKLSAAKKLVLEVC